MVGITKGSSVECHSEMQTTKLGRCPNCDAPLPASNKLIEYRTAAGWTAVFAACEPCDDVVHPR